MPAWRLTVRHGPDVSKQRFDDLDSALQEARRRVDEVKREGRLGTVSAFRDYTPDKRVQARVEISGKGLVRRREAGIDVMGDGTLVAYAGAIRKRALDADTLDEALARVREALVSA